MRILVVEDEPALRSYLVPLLERSGWTAEAVGTGAEALQVVDERRPDLVHLDVGLPDLSGLDVCREIRRRAGYLPVVMLTGLDSREDELRGFDVRADDYITKPVVPETLVAVDRSSGNRRAARSGHGRDHRRRHHRDQLRGRAPAAAECRIRDPQHRLNITHDSLRDDPQRQAFSVTRASSPVPD